MTDFYTNTHVTKNVPLLFFIHWYYYATVHDWALRCLRQCKSQDGWEGLRMYRYSNKQDSSVNFLPCRTFKKKAESSTARSLPVENLLPQNVGSIINYF